MDHARGRRPGTGRQAGPGAGVPLAALPIPTPPASFGFWVPAQAQPSFLPPGVSPHTLAQLRAQPCPVGRSLSVQTPGPPAALTLGPQVEEIETEATPDVWKKSKRNKKSQLGAEGLALNTPEPPGTHFVCPRLGFLIRRKDKKISGLF